MGGSGGATFNRGINRVAGTPRCSYRSPGNTFNVDKEYIWVVAVALHLIEALIELQVHQKVATDFQVTNLMLIKNIYESSGGATFNRGINRSESTPREVATDLSVTHLMGIKKISG